jgi:hypothetical protein
MNGVVAAPEHPDTIQILALDVCIKKESEVPAGALLINVMFVLFLYKFLFCIVTVCVKKPSISLMSSETDLLQNQAIPNQRNSFSRGFPLLFNVETRQAFGALFQIPHYYRKFLYCKTKILCKYLSFMYIFSYIKYSVFNCLFFYLFTNPKNSKSVTKLKDISNFPRELVCPRLKHGRLRSIESCSVALVK